MVSMCSSLDWKYIRMMVVCVCVKQCMANTHTLKYVGLEAIFGGGMKWSIATEIGNVFGNF